MKKPYTKPEIETLVSSTSIVLAVSGNLDKIDPYCEDPYSDNWR